MNSKAILILAIILVLIGIGIAVGSSSQENETSTISPEEAAPRLIERGLTEGVGVASEP